MSNPSSASDRSRKPSPSSLSPQLGIKDEEEADGLMSPNPGMKDDDEADDLSSSFGAEGSSVASSFMAEAAAAAAASAWLRLREFRRVGL